MPWSKPVETLRQDVKPDSEKPAGVLGDIADISILLPTIWGCLFLEGCPLLCVFFLFSGTPTDPRNCLGGPRYKKYNRHGEVS